MLTIKESMHYNKFDLSNYTRNACYVRCTAQKLTEAMVTNETLECLNLTGAYVTCAAYQIKVLYKYGKSIKPITYYLAH